MIQGGARGQNQVYSIFSDFGRYFNNHLLENIHIVIIGIIGQWHLYSSGQIWGQLLYLNYSKTCLKRPLKKKTKNRFSGPIIA